MKRFNTWFFSLLFVVSSTEAAFTDVSPKTTYQQSILALQSQSILSGYPDGSFKPEQPINRAEFTKIIVEAQFSEKEINICNFSTTLTDIQPESWYEKPVCLAEQKGIIKGFDDKTFRPAQNISFAEAAKIVSLSFGFKPDEPLSSPWYKPYLVFLSDLEAIPKTINSVEHQVTRAEMAALIYRLQTQTEPKAGLQSLSLSTGSGIRTFQKYVPQRRKDKPNAALFILHGTGGSSTKIEPKTNFNPFAEAHNFIAVYPDSLKIDGVKKWDVGATANLDLEYIKQIIESIAQTHSSVEYFYAAGMSNGGVFAQTLGCHINNFEGIASVSGSLNEMQLARCKRDEALPFIGFYGDKDVFDQQLKFEQSVDYFSKTINQCQGEIIEPQPDTNLADNTTVDLIKSAKCSAPVHYYRIKGGGHFWPGHTSRTAKIPTAKGSISQDINASALIVDFFKLGLKD